MIVITDVDSLQPMLDELRRDLAREVQAITNRIITNQDQQGALIVATAKEVIDSIVTQLNRAVEEITAKISEGTVTADDLAPLQAVAETLDNLAPEVPAEEVPVEPLPEVPAEEPAEGEGEDNPGQL